MAHALYEAKTAGRDQYVIFQREMQAAVEDRLILELLQERPTALILDEFQTWFDGLTNKTSQPLQAWAFNFIQIVSEIAKELFLSVKTVSTYRSRILEKMNFKSNADITYYAVKNGLIA